MLLRKIPLILFITTLSINNSFAETDQRLTFGAKLLGAGWEGDNGAGGTDFKSDKGGQFGLNVSYKLDKFYAGLNIQSGEYEFKGNAPDRFTILGRLPSTNVKIKQTDIDLLFGYYFWQQVSLFVDIKVVNNDWLDEPYEQNFVGLGLGASGYIPINNKWTLFGSAGFIGGGDIDDNNERKVGEGKSWALEVGTVYAINENHFLNAGIKTRQYNFEFLDSTKQEYNINAIFFGYNYSFSL